MIKKFFRWLYNLEISYKAWKLGREETEIKELPDGTTVYRTEKSHTYFVGADNKSMPVMVSKEEGERLWHYADEGIRL
jgi:hypothetical protein